MSRECLVSGKDVGRVARQGCRRTRRALGPRSCGAEGRRARAWAAVVGDGSEVVWFVLCSPPSRRPCGNVGRAGAERKGGEVRAARARAAGRRRRGAQVDIAKCHIRVVLKRLRDSIPRRRLLASSASPGGGDPPHEEPAPVEGGSGTRGGDASSASKTCVAQLQWTGSAHVLPASTVSLTRPSKLPVVTFVTLSKWPSG